MKMKKEKVVSAVATISIILMLFGATYAYFASLVDAGKTTDVEITANTVDVFTFLVGDPIKININQENFASGKGSISDSTFASAMLSANNKTNTATEHYYLYVNIISNSFTYSKDTDHPEIIMNITNEDGTEITSLEGYDYVTATDASNESFKGFDITNKSGVIEVFTNREITTTSTRTEKWNVTVTFINYDFNQAANAGKSFKAKLMIQKEVEDFRDLKITVADLPSTYGATGSITCGSSTASYSQKYNEISISNIDAYDTCKLVYTEPISKTYLNDYILGLAGTTQGDGQVVSETADIPDYSTASAITESSYTNQSVFSDEYVGSDYGTEVSGIYSFADGKWTSDATAMTSDIYYHFKFTPSESGYYQMCYELSSGSTNNKLFAYVGSTRIYINGSYSLSASESTAKTGCVKLGYVSNSSYIMITQKTYDTIATLSFSINKVETVNNVNAGTRYEGTNPNNYIWFNNELWRIIGVFDSGSHGQSNTNLVKIMREDSIGFLAWDKTNTNNWVSSSLNSLLNGAYYNAQDGTDSGYCYMYSTEVQANCDYRTNGIQDGYRSMIQNVTWYLGGYWPYYGVTNDFYRFERGTMVYSGNTTSTTGYVGLMYPSDYGYSVLSSSCARTTTLRSYSNSSCGGQSWIPRYIFEWTLSHSSLNSDSDTVFYLDRYAPAGKLPEVNAGKAVRPVLYLKAGVYYEDGDGSMENPIIIGE